MVVVSCVWQSYCPTGLPEIKLLKERKITKREAPSAVEPRLGACRSRAPAPPVPMVFSMRNYVRVARILPFGGVWGRDRIAMQARNVPGGLAVDYSGRA